MKRLKEQLFKLEVSMTDKVCFLTRALVQNVLDL